MKKTLLLHVFLLPALFGFFVSSTHAQTATASAPLFKTIQSLDAKLFGAYNRCDLATLSSLVAEDLEFYHDVTGFSPGREALVEGVKKNVCGKVNRNWSRGHSRSIPLPTTGRSR
jgi:hypothetical protein